MGPAGSKGAVSILPRNAGVAVENGESSCFWGDFGRVWMYAKSVRLSGRKGDDDVLRVSCLVLGDRFVCLV